jgi:predicted nuclease with TOPRIM domain
MAIPSLKLLEEKLDGMLERHARICREKAMLSQRLSEQQEANGRLREQLQQYEQEREEIRTKLERILGQFDGLGIALSDEGGGDESLG